MKAAGRTVRVHGLKSVSQYFFKLFGHISMDSQPPQKPWERRVPGAMTAPVNYR